MALVDDDDVPPRAIEVVAVLKVLLERVHRNDGAIEVVERVVVRGDDVADTLQTDGVETYERDGEPGLPFLLELCDHWRSRKRHLNV